MRVIIVRGLPGAGKTAFIDAYRHAEVVKGNYCPRLYSTTDPRYRNASGLQARANMFAGFMVDIFNPRAMPEIAIIDGVNAFPANFMPYVLWCVGSETPFEVWRFTMSLEDAMKHRDVEGKRYRPSDLRAMDKHLKLSQPFKERLITPEECDAIQDKK